MNQTSASTTYEGHIEKIKEKKIGRKNRKKLVS